MSRRQYVPLGVIIERRASDHPWLDHTIRPVSVVPGMSAPEEGGGWRLMMEGDGWAHFHAGTLNLELFAGETEGYRNNLANSPPHVYVVLSPGTEPGDPEMVASLVTACPFEAERYMEDSDMVVEGVPMPDEIAAWVGAFVEAYHVEEEFVKRKRRPYDPRKGDMRARPLLEEGE